MCLYLVAWPILVVVVLSVVFLVKVALPLIVVGGIITGLVLLIGEMTDWINSNDGTDKKS